MSTSATDRIQIRMGGYGPPTTTHSRALKMIGARLEANGTKVARGSRALADERLVKDLIICQDPGGNRLEFFHGAAVASDPFKPGRAMSGFRTGPLGMGHAVLHCTKIDELVPFYRDILGFRLKIGRAHV